MKIGNIHLLGKNVLIFPRTFYSPSKSKASESTEKDNTRVLAASEQILICVHNYFDCRANSECSIIQFSPAHN